MKKLFILLLALALPALMAPTANAQRGFGEDWELIGQATVGFGVDNDVIPISDNDSWHRDRAFRQLRFVAEGNDVFMIKIRLVYVNGYGEDLRVDKLIPVGGQLPVPLGGERKYLRQIEMTYKSKPGFRIDGRGFGLQQAVVKVYGEQARRRDEPRAAVYGGGWEPIDTQRFERTDEGFEFRNTRRSRVGQIRIKMLGDNSANIDRIVVRFGNGSRQEIRVDQRLEPGQETAVFDLEGERRFLDEVRVFLKPARRPGQATAQLVGTERPGGADGDRYERERGRRDR